MQHGLIMSSKSENPRATDTSSPVRISNLGRDGTRSAFTPYKPSTVLTNLQRGNIQTQTPSAPPERTIHELAAQGELILHNIDESIDVDSKDNNGYTALMWASSYGQLATLRWLLNHNASPYIVGKQGETALLFASANGHVAIIKELLKHNVDIDIKDFKGNTALMHAAHGNHAFCIHELLSAGIDFTAENNNSETAYDIAVNFRSKQVQLIIEKHMMNLLLEAKN